jgi:hypothetical protein
VTECYIRSVQDGQEEVLSMIQPPPPPAQTPPLVVVLNKVDRLDEQAAADLQVSPLVLSDHRRSGSSCCAVFLLMPTYDTQQKFILCFSVTDRSLTVLSGNLIELGDQMLSVCSIHTPIFHVLCILADLNVEHILEEFVSHS